MDASDIGFTLAFPGGLLDGLEAVAAGFELLDAAAAAGGDDAVLAGQVFEALSQALAPADQAAEPEEDDAAEGAVPLTVSPRPVSRPGVGGSERPAVMPARSRSGEAARATAGTGAKRGGEGGLVHRGGAVSFEAAARSVAPDEGTEGVEEPEPAGLLVVAEAPVAGLPVAPMHGGRSSRMGGARRSAGKSGRSAGLGKSGLTASVAYARGAEGRMLDAIAPVQAHIAGGDGGDSEGSSGWEAGSLGMDGPKGQGGRSAAGWDVRSVAPGVGTGGSAARTVAPGGGLFPERAVAPQPQEGGGRDGGDRPVVLDGRLVGQWLSERMARDASRPGAGTTFFDPRQAPAWTPSGVL